MNEITYVEKKIPQKFPLPRSAAIAMERLRAAGFEAFLVGGCVRDFLLGAEPSDVDITSSATPPEVQNIFAGCNVIATGLKHGTVTVMIEGEPVEITTYRVDAGYSDGRHPDSVAFTRDLREDLARRDFTVNAMAFDGRRLVDCFDGQRDLRERVIRAVGEPDRRFEEDALRIMRALRFASCLSFRIEERTGASLLAKRELLRRVSVERIACELSRLLCGADVRRVILQWVEVLGVPVPELLPLKGFAQHNKHHIYDVLEHTSRVVEGVEPTPVMRLAALLHDVGKPASFHLDEDGAGHFIGHDLLGADMAAAILTRLKFDTATRERVTELVKYHDLPVEPTEKSVRRRLRMMTPAVFFQLMQLKRADNLAQHPDYRSRLLTYDRVEALAHKVIEAGQCFSLKDLAINGRDVMALGLQGPAVGALLDKLLSLVVDGEIVNEKGPLAARAAEEAVNLR